MKNNSKRRVMIIPTIFLLTIGILGGTFPNTTINTKATSLESIEKNEESILKVTSFKKEYHDSHIEIANIPTISSPAPTAPANTHNTNINTYLGIGAGTENDPYIIETEYQLRWLSENPNFNDSNYKLANDINLSSTEWTPIGTQTIPFGGIFDGDGHTITGLRINAPTQNYVGLFGFVDNGTIRNVGISGATVTGANHVGIIAGAISNDAEIIRTYTTGTLQGTNYIGGIAGSIDSSTITDSYSMANVTGSNYIGGIAGLVDFNSGIENAYAAGAITGSNYVGGIVGTVIGGNIENTVALGRSIQSAGTNVGRITGATDGGILTNNKAWEGMSIPHFAVTSGNGEGISTQTVTTPVFWLANMGWDTSFTWYTAIDHLPLLRSFQNQSYTIPSHLTQ